MKGTRRNPNYASAIQGILQKWVGICIPEEFSKVWVVSRAAWGGPKMRCLSEKCCMHK